MNSRAPDKQQGFMLITVVLIISVLAALALMLSTTTSLDNALVTKHRDGAALDYTAESAMAHTVWQLAENNSCSGYSNLPDTSFGEHSYSATVSPSAGSPVDIIAVGSVADNSTRSLIRNSVKVYQAPIVVTLQPDASGQDTHINSGNNKDEVSYGGESEIRLSRTGNSEYRGLLKFDLAGLPAQAKVISAQLGLYLESPGGATDNVNVHRMKQSWLEGTSSDPKDSTDGASWSSYDAINNWAEDGGDHDSSVAASTSLTSTIDWYSWDLTALVGLWLDQSIDNNGVLLKRTGSTGNALFTSSDSSDTIHRPKLTITYACECGVTCGSAPSLIYRDEFKSRSCSASDYRGSDGDLDWSANPWTETTDDGNSCGGNVEVLEDPLLESGNYRLHVRLNESLQRTVDLSMFTSAFLHFDYRRENLSSADRLTIEVWDDSAGAWAELGRLEGPATDSTYLSRTYDISAFASANTVIRLTTFGTGSVNHLYLDNIQIDESASAVGGALLFVVADATTLTSEESQRKSLIESWGYTVTLINDSASSSEFDTAATSNEVAYVPEDILSGQLDTKLRDVPIGVVNEERFMFSRLGFSDSVGDLGSITAIDITDNTHEITAGFAIGTLEILDAGHGLQYLNGATSANLKTLAEHPSASNAILATLDTGDALEGGGNAAGRRVWLPWGQNDFAFSSVNADGQTLMRRAIEWAAGTTPTISSNAHWALDDASGTAAVDSLGNHTGTLVNGPVWVPTGKIGGALEFDGVDDYIDVGNFDVVGSGITMTGWFNTHDLTNEARIISKAEGVQQNEAWWQLSYVASGSDYRIRMRIKAGGSTTTFIDSSVALQTDQWYLAAATYDNATSEMKLYLDGVEVASRLHSTGGALDADPTVPVWIGANGDPTRFFDGTLDDIRLYDRPLDSAEVAALFTAGGGGGSGNSAGTYRDEFNTNGSFAGDDGTRSWSTDWIEIGESDGPGSGDIATFNDAGQFQLRIRDSDFGNSEGVEREADLSACTSATLTFSYRRDSLDDSNDYVSVDVSDDGGTNWTELDRLQGSATDPAYQPATYDISAHMAANTRIRLLGSPNLGNTDTVYFDDVEIECL